MEFMIGQVTPNLFFKHCFPILVSGMSCEKGALKHSTYAPLRLRANMPFLLKKVVSLSRGQKRTYGIYWNMVRAFFTEIMRQKTKADSVHQKKKGRRISLLINLFYNDEYHAFVLYLPERLWRRDIILSVLSLTPGNYRLDADLRWRRME